METKEYQDKMKEMLNDEATYEKLKKDPTKKYKTELTRKVNSLEKEGKITKDQYWYLYPTLDKVPRMYGSPKGRSATQTNCRLHTDNSIQSIQEKQNTTQKTHKNW